jgi:curved DNA-binding protein CbpA
MSFEKKNYYERLGVPRDATEEQIKEAYREIARVYHPDSHFFDDLLGEVPSDSLSERDMETFRMVTEAYNTLISETRRKKYDESLISAVPGWRAPGAQPKKAGQESKAQTRSQSNASQVRVRVKEDAERAAPREPGPSPVVRSVAEMIQEQRAIDSAKHKKISPRVKLAIIVCSGFAVLAIVGFLLLLLL